MENYYDKIYKRPVKDALLVIDNCDARFNRKIYFRIPGGKDLYYEALLI